MDCKTDFKLELNFTILTKQGTYIPSHFADKADFSIFAYSTLFSSSEKKKSPFLMKIISREDFYIKEKKKG